MASCRSGSRSNVFLDLLDYNRRVSRRHLSVERSVEYWSATTTVMRVNHSLSLTEILAQSTSVFKDSILYMFIGAMTICLECYRRNQTDYDDVQ